MPIIWREMIWTFYINQGCILHDFDSPINTKEIPIPERVGEVSFFFNLKL